MLKTIVKLRSNNVEVDPVLRERVESHYRLPYPSGDVRRAIEWLEESASLVEEFHDALDGIGADLCARQTEFDAGALMRQVVSEPQARVNQELGQLRNARFSQERLEWRRRVDENLAAFREKQERQAQKLLHDVERPDKNTVIVRATEAWWNAYETWQRQAFDAWRQHLAKLLSERWAGFIERETGGIATALRIPVRVPIPEPDIAALPDPMSRRVPRDAQHYRDQGGPSDSTDHEMQRPEEVIDLRSAKIGPGANSTVATLRQFGGMVAVPIAMAIPGGGIGARVGVGVAIAAATFVAGHYASKSERERVVRERAEKAVETLKKRLIDDFRKRMDRHRHDVERFQREFASGVQQIVVDRLNTLIDEEIRRRNDEILPKLRKDQAVKQRELRNQSDAVNISSKVLDTVNADIQERLRILRDRLDQQAG